MEALACGLPVITTPVTGIVEVVRDAQNGLLVPIGDAKALAEAIESVIRRPELYQRLSANARPSVEENFDLESTAGCLFNLFSGEEHEDLLSLS